MNYLIYLDLIGVQIYLDHIGAPIYLHHIGASLYSNHIGTKRLNDCVVCRAILHALGIQQCHTKLKVECDAVGY